MYHYAIPPCKRALTNLLAVLKKGEASPLLPPGGDEPTLKNSIPVYC